MENETIAQRVKKRVLFLDSEKLKKDGIINYMSPVARKKKEELDAFFNITTELVDDYTLKLVEPYTNL